MCGKGVPGLAAVVIVQSWRVVFVNVNLIALDALMLCRAALQVDGGCPEGGGLHGHIYVLGMGEMVIHPRVQRSTRDE